MVRKVKRMAIESSMMTRLWMTRALSGGGGGGGGGGMGVRGGAPSRIGIATTTHRTLQRMQPGN